MFSVPAPTQQAQISVLTKEEAAKAAELYKTLTKAEAEWIGFKNAIREKYGKINASLVPPEKVGHYVRLDGTQLDMAADWSDDIEFSADFRFVVPKRH